MEIKQSVKNTMTRLYIDYQNLDGDNKTERVENRFGGGVCMVTPLIAECIYRIYQISDGYENGMEKALISDFDRLRLFVLSADQEAYYTCID